MCLSYTTVTVVSSQKVKIDNKSSLMLVPWGVRPPDTFQRRFPLDYMMFTNSVADFYQVP
jgi:hypothetical protein